ncbi:MAG: Gfo/Idh/MocA family oxidoreductase [Solirubrobacteraceae bacterium]|jgi:predicted dehydrogenase
MRLGLLSTARINELLVAGAREVPGVEVVAIGSRDRARAEAQAQALGVPRAHASYEALLADPEIDAVYIALPNSLHVEWSLRALQAGRHVLCEKPLSRHPADVERAFDAAERGGLVLAEGFMWRHHLQARRLLELLGEIGELRLIRASFSFLLERAGDLRLQAALDGGALMDVGCYCVSAARLLAGEPLAVSAQQVRGGDGVDVRLTGLLRFAGDVLATIDCGLDLAARDELEVTGTRGVLWLDDPWHARSPAIELRRADGSVEHVAVEPLNPYACELQDFAATVAGEQAPRYGREDALAQARVIAALYASAEANQPTEVER